LCGKKGETPPVVGASGGEGMTKVRGSGKESLWRADPRRRPGEEAKKAELE